MRKMLTARSIASELVATVVLLALIAAPVCAMAAGLPIRSMNAIVAINLVVGNFFILLLPSQRNAS